MKRQFLLVVFYTLSVFVFAQNGKPHDYLNAAFHAERREALRKMMPANSVAVFFVNPIRNRSNDVDYLYHQDPNFYYLTGYKEPNSVFVLFSENQLGSKNDTYNEILFVQEKNPKAEMWTGKRLGVEGAKNELGFKKVLPTKAFKTININYNNFDKVFFVDFKEDYRDDKKNTTDLFSLIEAFKHNSGYNFVKHISASKQKAYKLIRSTTIKNSANVAQILGKALVDNPELQSDEIIEQYVNSSDVNLHLELKTKVLNLKSVTNLDNETLSTFMAGLREIKTDEEVKLIKRAVQISAIGQQEIMKAMHNTMSELEIQGVHEFVYKKYGAEYEGYPSIVGAGNNGCVLHYVENSKTNVGDNLVLMDLGAEYHGYTADVTRTIPANGTFNPEQKLIYDLVYEAQEAGINAAVIGNNFGEPTRVAMEIITKGLKQLGIIKNNNEARRYFPHGATHHIGLDVHDPGLYGALKENMVVTVEPGIYIPDGSPCDKKWWGIAVRIEDDILITGNGPVNLSAEAPRKSSEIETFMKQTSVLNNFELPKID